MGKTIADLPALQAVRNETLIPVYQPGTVDPAQRMSGKQFREFAEQGAIGYIDAATSAARRAEAARDSIELDEHKMAEHEASAAASAKKAKLYADQCEASVSGVASFNGRGGNVVPKAGDYTANMVGAADAADHQVETYTTLSSLNILDADMLQTDAEANFLTIFKALPSRSELWLYTSTTIVPNLQASIAAKLTADLGIVSPPNLLDCRFEKVGAYTLFIRVTAQNYNATHLWHLKEFNCVMRYSEGAYQDLSPFILSRDPGGFYGPANKPTAEDVGARPADWMPTAEDVGSVPIVNAPTVGGDTNDMNKELTSGAHLAFYRTDGTTEGTPHKAGKTTLPNATILSCASTPNRGVQIAFIPGSNLICVRRLYGSTPGPWGSVYTENSRPTGTYTGNGDAASRVVETGGSGNAVMIYSTKGMAIVSPRSGIGNSTSGLTSFPSSACKFSDGALTIATTEQLVNATGITYTYQVL